MFHRHPFFISDMYDESSGELENFSAVLLNWYAQKGRHDLPWRQTSDPYKIWLSEVILQQTRVVQGMSYYLKFVERFPTVFELAAATEDEVLSLWQGLGYYSRARNLHHAAQSIAKAGHFPTTYEEVKRLKGIGSYTAAAICSFAYNADCAVVDGNVFRVLSRFFGIETAIDSAEGKRAFSLLAQELLPSGKACTYNSAIMDFGALQCSPQNPTCGDCPLVGGCSAFQQGKTNALPVKSKKIKAVQRFFVYVYLKLPGGRTLLHRRGKNDIWAGLYEPLLMEFQSLPTEEEVVAKFMETANNTSVQLRIVKKGIKHVLTHQRLQIELWEAEVEDDFSLPGFLPFSEEERDKLGCPQVLKNCYQDFF